MMIELRLRRQLYAESRLEAPGLILGGSIAESESVSMTVILLDLI